MCGLKLDDLFDDILLRIFSWIDLRSRMNASSVSKRFSKINRKSWRSLQTLTFHEFFEPDNFPRGRVLNRALSYFLKRCGRNLFELKLNDPEPENRLVRVNENTFVIIGRYCKHLEVLNFEGLLIINDLLHDLVRYVSCTNIRHINFNRSFAHQCPIHDGLTAVYNACPALNELNLNSALNARARDCNERWPMTLTKVYLDHCMSLTGYSLLSLSKCSPMLTTFSMSGNIRGMNFGIISIINGCPDIEELILRDFPGEDEVGMQICQLVKLRKLHLGKSNMVTDNIISAIAYRCRQLEDFECNSEHSKNDELTNRSLSELAEYCTNLQDLQIGGRQLISDDGLVPIILNRKLQSISIAGCANLSGFCLEVLTANCHKLHSLDISDIVTLKAENVLNLCRSWMENEELSRCYHLELTARNLRMNEQMFKSSGFKLERSGYQPMTITIDGIVPRRSINVWT